MKRPSFCNHYRAASENTTCNAGVEYSTVMSAGHNRCPCFPKEGVPPKNAVLCDKAEYPTPEEIAEWNDYIAARFAKTVTARVAIEDHLGGPWKSGTPRCSGEIPCPCCDGGKLRFSRAGINGHIHAGCTTANCVQWME